MKTYTLTKREFINAIAKEVHLRAGNFKHKETKNCSVCAVGSVLRSVNPNFSDDDGYRVCNGDISCDTEFDLNVILESEQNIFSKVSSAFEYVAQHNFLPNGYKDIELARLHAINVAEAFCPDVVEFVL